MCESRHISLLDDVLSLAVIADDAAGDAIELLIVDPHDGTEGIGIASLRPQGQFHVSGRGNGGLKLRHGILLTIGCEVKEKVPGKSSPSRRAPETRKREPRGRLRIDMQLTSLSIFGGRCGE